ncbi:hypothetical protein BBD41_20895 [Paenibacillus ihbetae]|uniref:Uncharacterized protein n=2 Tax=Paenibacillus ihbetae TaxID=1870820 RepID=A0A1B2E9L9_9BACL|nr:hypothetical protein BBD41_20895 [Paenibacillus ihbetae]
MKEKGISKGRVSFFRGAFLGLAWVLAACIVVQTLIAGMALFRDGSMWRSHVMFVHIFEIVPLLMLVAAFAGSMAARYKWSSLALLLLVFAQYVTANVPTAGALHPVLAISMFWLAVETARAAGRGLRRGKETGA